MRSRFRLKWRTVAVIALLMVWISCADHCGQLAYTNVIHERTKAFAYTASPDAIWSETTKTLEASGVAFAQAAPPIAAPAISPWVGKPGDRSHYTAQVIAGSGKEHYLEVHRVLEAEVDTYADVGLEKVAEPRKAKGRRLETSTMRDFDTEWAVLKALAPTEAAEIEVAAVKRSEEVRDVVASGCQ